LFSTESNLKTYSKFLEFSTLADPTRRH